MDYISNMLLQKRLNYHLIFNTRTEQNNSVDICGIVNINFYTSRFTIC